MFPKINILKIILKHIYTLSSYKTQKPSFKDYSTFVFLPLLITIFIGLNTNTIDKETQKLLIKVLAILAGFSFNLLAIIFGYRSKIERTIKDTNSIKNKYIHEIHSNIAFSIINAIVCIVLILLSQANFIIPFTDQFSELLLDFYFLVNIGLKYATIFLLIFYLITLLMIIKRINILFSVNYDD